MTAADRIVAVVPVAAIEGAKTRLGESLDAEERHDLVERLLRETLAALLAVQGLAEVVVISPDRAVLDRALASGARTLRQRTSGLNDGIREAREDVVGGGADGLLIVPIDLPFITAPAIDEVVAALIEGGPSQVILVADRHGSGTNVLALRPPAAIEVAFGPGSRAAHRRAAERAGVEYRELTGPLSVDLDTPDDLEYIGTLDASGLRVG